MICDQMEDPAQAKGLVRREVTRVLTRGIIVDPDKLPAKEANYLAAACWQGAAWGLAFPELSTGDFRLTEGRDLEALWEELCRLRPVELLVPEGGAAAEVAVLSPLVCLSPQPPLPGRPQFSPGRGCPASQTPFRHPVSGRLRPGRLYPGPAGGRRHPRLPEGFPHRPAPASHPAPPL